MPDAAASPWSTASSRSLTGGSRSRSCEDGSRRGDARIAPQKFGVSSSGSRLRTDLHRLFARSSESRRPSFQQLGATTARSCVWLRAAQQAHPARRTHGVLLLLHSHTLQEPQFDPRIAGDWLSASGWGTRSHMAGAAAALRGGSVLRLRWSAALLIVCMSLPCAAVRNSLHDASAAGDVGRIEALIEAGASLDVQSDDQKGTPLHLAAANGHGEAITVLAKAGASLEAQDHQKWTALHVAAWKGSAEAIRALVKAGASLEAKAEEKRTPLHVAAATNRPKAVKALVEAGASLEARAEQNGTPLHVAASAGHAEAIRALAQAGG